MGLTRAFASGLQVGGLALIALAGWLIVPWLGLLLAGIGCVLLGFALER